MYPAWAYGSLLQLLCLMPRVKPNGSKWHMQHLPCFVRLTQTRGHNGLESQNRKIKLAPLLHFVVGVSWILMNTIMITPFQFNPFTGTLKSRQHSESLVHHSISQTSYLVMILIRLQHDYFVNFSG